MIETKKLNATFLKRVDRVVLKNTETEVNGFDFFFELLANLTKISSVNPIELFEPLIDTKRDIEETMNLYSDFYNAIITAFGEFSNGKSSRHLKKNLFNLLTAKLPDDIEDEYFTERVLVSLMRPLMFFLHTHDIAIENIKELRKAINSKFSLDTLFADDIVDMLLLNTRIKKKVFNLNDLNLNIHELLSMMIDNIIDLSVIFLKIAKDNRIDIDDNVIQTEMIEFGEKSEYNGINYDAVSKDDFCPCGSGKKYKKCCRKAWEYPLTTLSPQKILVKPKLSLVEITEYYYLYNILLTFVQHDYADKNSKEYVSDVFEIQYDGSYRGKDYLFENGELLKIIEHLSDNPHLVDEFIKVNRDNINDEELEVYNGWKNFSTLECSIMQKHNNSEVFVWDIEAHKIYLVYGLYDPLASIVRSYPFLAKMVLLPFKGRIVFNGILVGNNIEYGKTMLRMMVNEYQEDIDKNGIILEIKQGE